MSAPNPTVIPPGLTRSPRNGAHDVAPTRLPAAIPAAELCKRARSLRALTITTRPPYQPWGHTRRSQVRLSRKRITGSGMRSTQCRASRSSSTAGSGVTRVDHGTQFNSADYTPIRGTNIMKGTRASRWLLQTCHIFDSGSDIFDARSHRRFCWPKGRKEVAPWPWTLSIRP